MKKLLTYFLISFGLFNCVYAQENINYINENQVANVLYHQHSYVNPIYVQNGAYTYIFNNLGDIMGYFRKTPSGKIVHYSAKGEKLYAYKATPSGDIKIITN